MDFTFGKEVVCERCGIAIEVRDPYAYSDQFGRSPTSSLMPGKGLGTNYGINPDGTSESYLLGGDNGKYKQPVKVEVQVWFLQAMVERDANTRAIQGRLAHKGLVHGNNEINLALEGDHIMSEVIALKKHKRMLLVDGVESTDSVIEGKSGLREWLLQLKTVNTK